MRLLFLPLFLILLSLQTDTISTLDKIEAQKAFALLNYIRTNPDKYYVQLHFPKNTKVKRTKLIWNDTLAKVAEAKAMDMAHKNYFAHVDKKGYGINYYINKAGYTLPPEWLKNKKDNFFESIYDGSGDGEEAIKTLIIDKGIPSLGHRKHLLGLEDWNAALADIGIGYARTSKDDQDFVYVSVVIATHN